MEYLDPKKQKRHHLFRWIGYSLITIGVALGSIILLWQAYGYGVKNGKVIQDGMIFLSSQPNPASVYINGVLNPTPTNTRLTIPSGIYNFSLEVPGYRPWVHTIPIVGGKVVHYDYPLLFPLNLSAKTIAKYSAAPSFASQSPSQQYLLIGSPTNFYTFYLYDLTNPTTAPVTLTIPSTLLASAHSSQSWQVVSWANDNQHILLEHIYDGSAEFIELDTQDPTQSININRTFGVNPTAVTLNNLRFDHFYFYNSSTQTLSKASVANTAMSQVEPTVLDYKTYGSNELLFVTSVGAPSGEVAVELNIAGKDYLVRYLPISQTYLLNLASYNGNDYAVVGSSTIDAVYIYKNIISQATSKQQLLPFRTLTIANPNYESFSPNAQFIMAENGMSFSIYDIFYDEIYSYTAPSPIDSPQTHATWMDGDRLIYTSSGKLTVADYDNTNRQTLTPNLSSFVPFFAPDYHSFFTLSSGKNSGVNLTQTSLLVKP